MPCTYCFKNNKPCRFLPPATKCSECTRRGRSCDGQSVASALTRLLAEQEKVDEQETAAEEELFILQTKLQTAVGRLARLRKQKRFLKSRGADLFRQNVASLEEQERREESGVVADLQEWAPGVMDWSSLGLDLEGLDPDLLSIAPEVPENPPGSPQAPRYIPLSRSLST